MLWWWARSLPSAPADIALLAQSVPPVPLAQNPTDMAAWINQLGLPVALLLMVIAALRVMWKVMSQRDQDALTREQAHVAYERDRNAKLQADLDALHADVRDRLIPALERSTQAMAKELSAPPPREHRGSRG
jgi:hypothetical protein